MHLSIFSDSSRIFSLCRETVPSFGLMVAHARTNDTKAYRATMQEYRVVYTPCSASPGDDVRCIYAIHTHSRFLDRLETLYQRKRQTQERLFVLHSVPHLPGCLLRTVADYVSKNHGDQKAYARA